MVAKTTRDPLFDMVKFVAMFMVIYSHVMSYRPGFSFEAMPSYAMNFIIAVAMPLFFMVSGYFSRRLHESCDWRKLANRLVKYFWPITIFAFFLALVESIVEHKYSIAAVPLWAFKKFLFGHWFFFALASCDVITFLAMKYGHSSMARALLGFGAFVVCLAASGRVWHTSGTVSMIPFYWLGLALLPKLLENRKKLGLMALVGAGVMVGVTFFCDNIATNGLGFYWDRFDLWHPEIYKALNMALRYIVGALGCFSIIGGLDLMCKIPMATRMAVLGTETFGIYLLQGDVIKHFSNPVVTLDAGAMRLLLASMAVFAFSFCVVKALKGNRLVEICVFGRDMF